MSLAQTKRIYCVVLEHKILIQQECVASFSVIIADSNVYTY